MLAPDLTQLASLQIELIQKGGPEKNGDLFEHILELQEDILNRFGLPLSPTHEKILWFDSSPSQEEVEIRLQQLKIAATEYLLTPTRTDLSILKEAQELSLDPFEVLAELKLPTHIYTLFVYNTILLKRKDNLEAILKEFQLLQSSPELLNRIGLLAQSAAASPTSYDPLTGSRSSNTQDILLTTDRGEEYVSERELVAMLEEAGLQYIHPFITSLSNLLNDEDY